MVRNIVRKAAILAPVLAGLTLGAAGTATARDQTCLWKIRGDHNAVYLLGSIHMLPPDAWPLPPAMDRAFRKAQRVVFEADLGDTVEAGLLMLQMAALPQGVTLSTVLPTALHQRLVTSLTRLGGDPGTLEAVKPWFAAITITGLELQSAGYDASDGIDMRLWNRAVREAKQTGGLEILAHQIEIMNNLSMNEQVELLRQSLDELEQVSSELGRLTRLWRTGRAEALARVLAATFKQAPNAYRRLVVERNRAWLPKIEAMTHADGDVLVVVGVLHLVGRGGLVTLLKSRGYQVVQQ